MPPAFQNDLMEWLAACQNADGGWPYRRGGPSWTEPTAYAMLALAARRQTGECFARGLRWIGGAQRPDGGWAPQANVRCSTWVTAVAALIGPQPLGEDAHARAIAWLLKNSGEETSAMNRVQRFLAGTAQSDPGWPWFPGTSAWVTPTSLAMLALRKAAQSASSAKIHLRLAEGAAYLMRHACADGGWNHGAARALDYDAPSYPETSGVALLALAGKDSPVIRKACDWAAAHLAECQTSEGESWLRLGLLAHRKLPSYAATRPARTVQNAALAVLASAAAEGCNLLLEQNACRA